MKQIRFWVPGDVQPQGRPRASRTPTGINMRDDPKSSAYKSVIKLHFNKLHVKEMLEGPLCMKVTVYRKMTKKIAQSATKRQMAIDGIIRPDTRPDTDNYAKTFMDALNGIAYKDDSQIVTLLAEKFYGEEAGAFIEIQTL